MTDVLTITVNPAVDISTSVARIAPVHKLRCAEERREPGGGGVNVARVLRRFGIDVLAAYPAGRVVGRRLTELLDQEGVRNLSIPISGETRENFTVFETDTQREYRFVLPGPRLSDEEWRAAIAAFTAFENGPRFVVASGSLSPGAPEDLYARIAAAAKASEAMFVVDASGPGLKAALDEGVHLVKPNLRELEDLVGASLKDRESRLMACRSLIGAGRAEIVALSLGAEGALLVTADRAWFAKPPPIKVVSSVGAGDSFLAVLVWALVSERPLEEALRYAVAAGSAALLAPGTQLCRPPDVEQLLSQVALRPA